MSSWAPEHLICVDVPEVGMRNANKPEARWSEGVIWGSLIAKEKPSRSKPLKLYTVSMSKTSHSIPAQASRPATADARRINCKANWLFPPAKNLFSAGGKRSLTPLMAALALMCSACIALGSAASLYITQNTSGNDTGADAANAHSAAWFNNPANWGSGAGQIGPGTTVHLSGTFTGSIGQTVLIPAGDGTAGSPITILCDPGCLFTSPCWGQVNGSVSWIRDGAIYVHNRSYINLYGNGGLITNTANGTGLANSSVTCGVHVEECSYVTVAGFRIWGMYKNLGNDSAGDGTPGIRTDGNLTNIRICSNNVVQASSSVLCNFQTCNGLEIDHNYCKNHCWGVAVAPMHGYPTSVSVGTIKIHDNEITDWSGWGCPGGTYHTDGVIVWSYNHGTPMTPEIYNNYIYGGLVSAPSCSATAFIFTRWQESDPAAVIQPLVHDNLLLPSDNSTALWSLDTGGKFYNNTVIGPNAGGLGFIESGGPTTLMNNIFVGVAVAMVNYYANTLTTDYNLFYNCSYVMSEGFGGGTAAWYTLATARSTFGNETHGQSSNPMLNGTYHIQAGSPAIGSGANFYTYFTADKDGNTLPSSGPWDLGAYSFASAISTNPVLTVSPTSLSLSGLVGARSTNFFTVQNTGSGTLAGIATVAAPFYIVPGSASYSLRQNQSQLVGVYYSNGVAGVTNGTVTFTGGGGFTAPVTATASNAPPQVSAIIQSGADVDPNAPGLQVYAGSLVQYSGSASDPSGLPLTWQWLYSVNGGGDVTVQSGSGAVTPVSFNYTAATIGNLYVWKLRVSNGSATAESDLTVGVEAAPSSSSNLVFSASSANITGPFLSANGYIVQTVETSVTNGGRATFNFTITNAGTFVVQALVNAATDSGNSFYLNIDADPQDPTMVWDIPLTSGFEERIASWRGNGTPTSNQYVPKMFDLTAGAHQLIIIGREANTELEQVAILQVPPPPQNLRIVNVGP